MPSPLIEKVLKGQSFEEFVLGAASIVSPLAREVDITRDGPLPKRERDTFHEDAAVAAKKRLATTVKMSFNRATKKAQAECRRDAEEYRDLIIERSTNAIRLKDMLKKVNALHLPDAHMNKVLKNIMVKQLEGALDSDGNPEPYIKKLEQLVPLTGREWKLKKIREARDDIEHNLNKQWVEDAFRAGDESFVTDLCEAVRKQARILKYLK